jgi:hypothetical protein
MVAKSVRAVYTHSIRKEAKWFGMIQTYALYTSFSGRLFLLTSKNPLQKMKMNLP